ncbi:MAG: F0F1 ATP synthase subunit epsilon [Candidatus Aminicenantia bacterium]
MSQLPDKINLEVITPERLLVKEEVDEVVVPGSLGYLGILPGHRPFLSTLGLGELIYRQGQERHYLSVFGGYVEVLADRVLVLADIGEKAKEIDRERAIEAQKRAEEDLKRAKKGELSEEEIENALIRLRKALIRLQVIDKSRSKT